MKSAEHTLRDQILLKVRQGEEFPAMSETICLLNRFNGAQDASISEFANLILRDYALTSKILKLVNTVNYSQYGEVTTISRAIILLGFENIRNIALTLMLFEHLQKRGKSKELIDTIIKSFYSGVLARNIAATLQSPEIEEAFICALFHTFGKVMVAFSVPEKLEEIREQVKKWNMPEDAACMVVLGVTFEELGMTIAKDWHFPKMIVHGMRAFRKSELAGILNDPLYTFAVLSNEIVNILSSDSGEQQIQQQIEKLIKSFKLDAALTKEKLSSLIGVAAQEFSTFAEGVKLETKANPFAKKMERWIQSAGTELQGDVPEAAQPDFETDSLKILDNIIESGGGVDTPENIFTKGIQDISNAILNNFALNDLVRIVLETMYRGMQLSGCYRTVFFLKDPRAQVMHIKAGFGNDIDEAKRWFEIDLDAKDIFNLAITKQSDLVIKDIAAPDVQDMLPSWYKNRLDAPLFVIVLPLVVNKKPLGLFYIEGEKEGFSSISSGHLNYLKILRDQIVLAIKQNQNL